MADVKVTRENHPVYKEAYRKGRIDAYKEGYMLGYKKGGDIVSEALHAHYKAIIEAYETELGVLKKIAKMVREGEKNA